MSCEHRTAPQRVLRRFAPELELTGGALCAAAWMCELGVRPEHASHWCTMQLAHELGAAQSDESKCDPMRTLALIAERAALVAVNQDASPFQRDVEQRAGFAEDRERRCGEVLVPVLRVISDDAIAHAIKLSGPRMAPLVDAACENVGTLVHTTDAAGRRTGVVVVNDWADLSAGIDCGVRFLTQRGHGVAFHATTAAVGELFAGPRGREAILDSPWTGCVAPGDFGGGLYFSPPTERHVAMEDLASKAKHAVAMLLVRLPLPTAHLHDAVSHDRWIAVSDLGSPFRRADHVLTNEDDVGDADFHVACLCSARAACVHVVDGKQRARAHHMSEHALPDQSTPRDLTFWQLAVDKFRAQQTIPAFVGDPAWLFGPRAVFGADKKPRVRTASDGRVVHQLVAREAGRRGAADCDFVVVLERRQPTAT